MAVCRAEVSKVRRRDVFIPFTSSGMNLGLTPCVGHAESSAFPKDRALYTGLRLSNRKCSSACWNLWCPVNADSWELQKRAMLGVLRSLSQVLAEGIVPYTACVSPGSSSSTISQGDRASLCLLQDWHSGP